MLRTQQPTQPFDMAYDGPSSQEAALMLQLMDEMNTFACTTTPAIPERVLAKPQQMSPCLFCSDD